MTCEREMAAYPMVKNALYIFGSIARHTLVYAFSPTSCHDATKNDRQAA